MSNEHKPLTAAEIGELLERHPATETPRTCPHCEDSMESGQHQCCCGHIGARDNTAYVEALERDYHALRNALPRILSMLQPPTDAAVREAVDNLALTLRLLGDSPPERVCIPVPWLRTLLSHVRAAQSPGLAEEQETLLREATVCLPYKNRGLAKRIRAAFPSLFGKEG